MGGVFLGQGRSTASSALIRGYTIQYSRTSKREVRGNVSVRPSVCYEKKKEYKLRFWMHRDKKKVMRKPPEAS